MSKPTLQCVAKVQPKDIMPAEAMLANPPDLTPDHGQCPPLSCPTTSRSRGAVTTAMDSTVSTLHEGIDTEKASDPEFAKIEEETTTEDKRSSETSTTADPMAEMTYPDGGLRAWLVVLGCFMFACSCMGWGLVWGILQDYYHTNMFPDTKLSILSTAGGLCNFTMNGSSYLFGGLGDRFGYKRMIAISCFLAYCCLLASAFTTKVYHLFLFQGGLLGLSQGIAMPLYMSLSSQWFLKRRGLATGLAVSGAGIGAGFESLIIRPMLVNLGFRRTMIIYSSMQAVVWITAWFLIKERIPRGRNANSKRRWLPKKVTGSFYSVALSMFFGIFGYLSPYYFSSTYTRQMAPSIDPSSLLISIPLVLMNFCLGFGRMTAGLLADIFGPINMFFCSFFFGGLLQIIFWTFARSYPAIIVFSIFNGFVGSWYMSLLPVVCAELFSVEGLSTVTGFMILANSPGQFSGTSIAGAILSASDNNWTAVTMYSGSMQLIGAACILYARFHKDKRILSIV
ncbi:MFS general substrate transporter [Dendrothele bispora CBS 962.96]|uniref:MFS general substrate transporter n=1 Tax=Dendrothele bispora (strain CBS 962.96) TaxID=1314807 RepID=A0A4S8KS21_DENBC|nr:MFS general substrate transporter [Dendrothele bispora CBS 962.96]